jgi:flavodoxin
MAVLVTYAGRYGAIEGVAARLAGTLRAEGLVVETLPMAAVDDLGDAEAFVIGGTVAEGRWPREATAFVERPLEILAGRPVWLFACVLRAGDPAGGAHHAAVSEAVEGCPDFLAARGHRVFVGRPVGDEAAHDISAGRAGAPGPTAPSDGRVERWARRIAGALGASVTVAHQDRGTGS